MDTTCKKDDEYRRYTDKNIKEMEELLRSILRDHGVEKAKERDSIRILDSLYRDENRVQKEVYLDYVRVLKNRYDELNYFPDKIRSCDLPLQLMIWETLKGSGSWSNVELLLSKLPCEMARLALTYRDIHNNDVPLFIAAGGAPGSLIQRMLELAPESINLRDEKKRLPLQKAIDCHNIAAVEIFVRAFPRGLLEPSRPFFGQIYEVTPMIMAFDKNSPELVSAMIKGLVLGLCSNNCDFTKLRSYDHVISALSGMKMETSVLSNFMDIYENKDFYTIEQMLLRYHMMANQKECGSFFESTKDCLEETFDIYLGNRIFKYVVECKLCLISREGYRKRKALAINQ